MSEQFDSTGAPRIRFGRRERRGALLGLTKTQLSVIGAVGAICLLWMVSSWDSFWQTGFIPLVAAGLLGGWSWHREPVVILVSRASTFYLRVSRKKNQYRRNVWRVGKEILMKPGQMRNGMPAPRVIGSFELPGALASIQFVEHPNAGAFTIDLKGATVAFTIDVASRAWQLRDSSGQEAAYDGFVDWMKSLGTIAGLVQVDARIRVDATPATELARYVEDRDSTASLQAREGWGRATAPLSAQLSEEYAALIADAAKRSMGFTNQITLTLSLRKLKEQIRNGGGGLSGIGTYIADLIPGLATSLDQSGLHLLGWLDGSQLRAALSRASDPVAYSARLAQSTAARRMTHQHPPVMAIREHSDRVELDSSVHQVFWIAEWPRAEVRTGFLEPLLYAGDATRVLLLQFRVVRDDKALAAVARAKSDMRVAMGIRTKRGMTVNREQERELEELEERENDLVDGFSDLEFRGFIAVSAGDPDELRRASAAIIQAAQPARLNLALMYWQQAAALVTTSLPLNVKG
jgi:hypothetical protein